MKSQASPSTPAPQDQPTFEQLGHFTRELHQALRALGAMPELQRVVQEIPDARTRLSYVGQMTADAAHKVLSLVEAAQPACTEQVGRGQALVGSITSALADPQSLSLEQARTMLGECRDYAAQAAGHAEQQGQVLSDIMMAQDFQDLSGQVIRKVVDMITRTEQRLVQLLLDSPEAQASADAPAVQAALEGPQTPDKALAQDDVDSLLASMGF